MLKKLIIKYLISILLLELKMYDYYNIIIYKYNNQNKLLPIATTRMENKDIIMRIGDQFVDKFYNVYSIEEKNNITPFNIKRFLLFFGFFVLINILSTYKLYYHPNNIFLLFITIFSYIISSIIFLVFTIGKHYFCCEIYNPTIHNLLSIIVKIILYSLAISFILAIIYI
jgi:hypothetical protein